MTTDPRVHGSPGLTPAVAGLERAAARLERFIAQTSRSIDAGLAFGPAGPLDPPEAELSAWLATFGEHAAGLSFGPRAWVGDAWDEASRCCQALLDQANRALGHDAWVETRSEATPVARTVMGWSGDAAAIWCTGLHPDLAAQHQRSFADSVAARTALIRKLLLVVRGAVALSARLTLPGGVLLALPMVLRFVDQVQAEAALETDRRPDAG